MPNASRKRGNILIIWFVAAFAITEPKFAFASFAKIIVWASEIIKGILCM